MECGRKLVIRIFSHVLQLLVLGFETTHILFVLNHLVPTVTNNPADISIVVFKSAAYFFRLRQILSEIS
jgi:hypothetical protein